MGEGEERQPEDRTEILIDRLSREQGIQPVESIADLLGEPLDDDEFQAFYDAIMSARVRP